MKRMYRARLERQEAQRLSTATVHDKHDWLAVLSNKHSWAYKCPVHGKFDKPYDAERALCPDCHNTIQVCNQVR